MISKTPTAVLWLRRLLFCGFALWMLSGPIYRQVLGGDNPYIREWRMYGMRAATDCRTLYEVREGEGWAAVSRWELEEFQLQPRPGKKTRVLPAWRDAVRAGRRLCRKLPDGTELRFRRKCGHYRDGWGEWKTSDSLCGEHE